MTAATAVTDLPQGEIMDDTTDAGQTADVDENTEAIDTQDAEGDPEGAEQLGDAGKKALDRMKEERKQAKAEATAIKRELEQLKSQLADKDKTPDEQAIETARREAAAEATAKANARILRSEVKAAAASKLADPKDALHLIDLGQFEVNDDGEVDAAEIAEAIDQLLRDKPYLAAQGGPKAPRPDRSQGARGTGAATPAQQFAAWSESTFSAP